MIIGVPIEYIGSRGREVAHPSGVQRPYIFEENPTYDGRKVCVVENEKDLGWFMNFVNHKKEDYRIYRVAEDLQRDIYFEHLAVAIMKNKKEFCELLARLGFVPNAEPVKPKESEVDTITPKPDAEKAPTKATAKEPAKKNN